MLASTMLPRLYEARSLVLSPAWRAFEGAATSDPEAAKLYDAMVQQRRHAMQEAA